MWAGVARRIRLTAAVIAAIMVTPIVMTAVAIIAIAVERIAAAFRLAMLIATRRRRLPASAVPIQTARIALTRTAATVRMPPLRWTPVVAIPVVAATVLIPRCRETPGTLISTDTSACAASAATVGNTPATGSFSFYLLTLFFLLQWLYQRAYLTTISSMPIFRSFSTALHNLYTVCRRL